MARQVTRADLNYAVPPWRARLRAFVAEGHKFTFANFLDRVTAVYGDRTAYVLDEPIDYPGFSGDILSYRETLRLVNRLSGALRALGVKKGDRVGLATLNRIEMAFCNFAVARLGALPVPMNFMLKANEIEHIVQRAGIELLVVDEFMWSKTIVETGNVPSVKHWAIVGANEAPDGIASLAELMRDAPDHIDPVEPASDDEVALLFFTSGTTGFPKGAMLSHGATMIGMRTHVRLAALGPRLGDRGSLLVMPVAHAAGYAQLLLNLGLGIPTFLLSRFDPAAIFERLDRLRPSVFSGSPAMYRMLLGAGATRHDWSSIKWFGGGADAFDDELVRSVRNLGARTGRFGARTRPWFIRGYGMAEANSHVAATPPFEAGDNCCGWVLPPVKHRLVDEDGRDVQRGQPGELLLKGPNLLKGYWNDPEATSAAFTSDGWFRTGDVLRKGKWGMLFFVGRSATIIKSGGYKISAAEVDHQLMAHPDVEHAATVGIPHSVKGERPFAAVKLRAGATATAEEILAWARERIAPYKCPRAIIVMDDMPFTFSLKPKHREVRERLIATLPDDAKSAE